MTENSMPDQSNFKCLVSACLCGIACRYDGTAATVPFLAELHAKGLALAVCPELLGGLSAPRPPCEIRNGRVVTPAGTDLTGQFRLGAEKTLALARLHGISLAVLKERSPSCGSGVIYDGSFEGRRIPGQGITCALLRAHGIRVVNEDDCAEIVHGC